MGTFRNYDTTFLNESFAQAIVDSVWEKGSIIIGSDPNFIRKDSCGAIIEKMKYGDTTEMGTGWEIDHIIPVALGGKDEINNLQPLQWQNNRAKSDKLPGRWEPVVIAKK